MPTIKHVFVLMMENRSFDHLFLCSGLPGLPKVDLSQWPMVSPAPDRSPADPPHEFDDVQKQMAGDPPMSGFLHQSYSSVSLQAFQPEQLPIMTALARNYLLFDTWFASMPGPTWPNRFFVHAASSGGLDDSPSGVTSLKSIGKDDLGFEFENGTIFDRLDQAKLKWRVYYADAFPQVLAIKGMVAPFMTDSEQFRRVEDHEHDDHFKRDLNSGQYDVAYTFIEPCYGLGGSDFSKGNSQHPQGSMAAGEQFIKYIYETIRNSPVWKNSALLITYDEHGGFFDHVSPPKATPPGDANLNGDKGIKNHHFAFDRFGPRVPAILVSPYAPKGGVSSSIFPGQIFDHTSIISSLRTMFKLGKPLTRRDGAAPDWSPVLKGPARLSAARAPTQLPPPYRPQYVVDSASQTPEDLMPMVEVFNGGFENIALNIDRHLAENDQEKMVASTHPAFAVEYGIDPSVTIQQSPQQERSNYIAQIASMVV
jgi:phospholipase C